MYDDVFVVRAPRRSKVSPEELAERAYDPARLKRGSVRGVEKLGPHQYRVEGRHEKYYDVNLELDTPCDCKDAQIRGRNCLHELAARLHDGDGPLIQSLGEMLLKAQQAMQQHTRRKRQAAPESER